MASFIIGYDIADPRRLGRVHREIRKHAMPLEYSVFLLVGSDTDRDRCLAALEREIDRRVDDVRCYVLPVRGLQVRIGCASLPTGIQWSGLPASIA